MGRKNTPLDVWKHVDMSGGKDACWPWKLVPGGGKGRGKPRAYFSLDGRKRLVTHVIWELVHGTPVPDGMMIRHKCDNSLCCNPAHLELGTHADNTDDMVSRDRHGLPSHVVRRIRVLLARGETHQSIADLYGVDRSVVTRIKNDKLHTHTNDYPSAADYENE